VPVGRPTTWQARYPPACAAFVAPCDKPLRRLSVPPTKTGPAIGPVEGSASRARTEICSSLRLRSVMCRAVLEVLMIFPAASFIGETVSEMCIMWIIRMRRLAWRRMSRVAAEESDHLVQREPTTHLS
jgi:hypothetical protein